MRACGRLGSALAPILLVIACLRAAEPQPPVRPPSADASARSPITRAQAEALLQDALQVRQTGSNTFALGRLTFDRNQRTITIPARVNMRQFVIEYALVHVSGKDHESLLVTEVDPAQLQTACLLLGLSPGPLTGARDQPEIFPATNAVTIEVAWATPGSLTRRPLAELVALRQPGTDLARAALTEAPWYYNGSQMTDSGFAAHEEGSIISLIRDPLALLNNPRAERDDDESYVPNARQLPPEGTPVEVILRLPRPPSSPIKPAASFPAPTREPTLAKPPLGPVGARAAYRYATRATPPLRSTVIERFTLGLGPVIEQENLTGQWVTLEAVKANAQRFSLWLLCSEYPSTDLRAASSAVIRYLLATEDGSVEFLHRDTGRAVLPESGAWSYLLPRPVEGRFREGVSAPKVTLLGHTYELEEAISTTESAQPPVSRRLELWPELRVGVPSNSRTRDSVRRHDGSDYERVRLSHQDYNEMIQAGLNCFLVDGEQARWIQDQPVFYWGLGGANVAFPECLYQSTYLGPALYLDEPAVHTRDYIIQPRFTNDPPSRQSVTPAVMFEAFRHYFRETIQRGTPWSFATSLRARSDVDLGTMHFPQPNLYSWETMIASAAWQLTAEPRGGPGAIVFEPPGRLGSRRTLPEMNMAYGCQLPPGDPANLSDPIIGFLRGAARTADKDWGISIYGAVDRADAPWLLTRAYDLGAKYFFFYDNAGLACVPYGECLALASHLQNHAKAHPPRDLPRLLRAAEVAILLPPGYDLGHVHMGKGNLWGLGELNLERRNRHGVPYRKVMANFFAEIERCLRLGVAFDLLWDLETLQLTGYREIVRVREDGRIEILNGNRRSVRKAPRPSARPDGAAPQLAVELSETAGPFPRPITARARVTEGSAPVYFTPGANAQGIYPNARVLWELYGPAEEDYRALLSGFGPPARIRLEGSASVIEVDFQVAKPGRYRLRAATTDLAGRSTVVWKTFNVDG